MRREFIVLGTRILTQHLSVFKPFKHVVVHHMPHQYSEDMSKCSTDYPLGLLFKDENKTSDLVDTLRHIQKEYVPKGPNGVSNVLVGGDRLTEGNCRNLQWAFSDGATKEDRLEGLVFKFEDWHAIRNLFEIYHRIFYDCTSSKDHGTLHSNMTKLRCSNAKQGPHAAYNAYKEFVRKDTAALFLAAAMEHWGLEDVTDIPDSFVPVDVAYGSPQLKRNWLHEKVGEPLLQKTPDQKTKIIRNNTQKLDLALASSC
uniref:DUF6589 domain-containing protein n=1 Tax=Knipowitschia caucasica TaxID=637954 RepID=A0AAV2LIY4_KNICA